MAKPSYQEQNRVSRLQGVENSKIEGCPVVNDILNQLTPERIKKELKAIKAVELPPDLKKWVKEYEKVGDRDRFLWKWLYGLNQDITVIEVEQGYQELLEKSKFLVTMFIVVVDDIVDRNRNGKFLEQLKNFLPITNRAEFNYSGNEEKGWVRFIIKVWKAIRDNLQELQNSSQYCELFYFYIFQVFNSMYYDYLINSNHRLISKKGAQLYSTYSMPVMIYIILDLMGSSDLDSGQIPSFIKTGEEAQRMARIGNWLSTWEREIKENDFTSGVFAYAIESGIITPEELMLQRESKLVKKIKESKIETTLLKEWESCYQKIFQLRNQVKALDINQFLGILEKLLFLEFTKKELYTNE